MWIEKIRNSAYLSFTKIVSQIITLQKFEKTAKSNKILPFDTKSK